MVYGPEGLGLDPIPQYDALDFFLCQEEQAPIYNYLNQHEENNNQIKENKQIVKLNEAQLRNVITECVKSVLNEIGDTPQGMYALGQVSGRAYDRMLNGTKQPVGNGIVALNPKYGKVAQDAAYSAAGGYMAWRKKFKEQNGREPSDEEYRAWMQNFKNGCNDYGKPESEKKGVVKISESQLHGIIDESIKKVLQEGWLNTYKQIDSNIDSGEYISQWKQWANKYAERWLKKYPHYSMEEVQAAINEYITNANPEALALDKNPRRDAYDFFFGHNFGEMPAIIQVLTNK